jgi:transposase-like protein
MMCVKYPLSLRNVEDLLSERGIDVSHDSPVLVELVWPHLRCRDPEEAGSAHAGLSSVALALG